MIPLKDKIGKELERQYEIYENSLPHSYVRVVNADDTSDDHPDNETSWREYWEKRTGKNLDELLRKKATSINVRAITTMIKEMMVM